MMQCRSKTQNTPTLAPGLDFCSTPIFNSITCQNFDFTSYFPVTHLVARLTLILQPGCKVKSKTHVTLTHYGLVFVQLRLFRVPKFRLQLLAKPWLPTPTL